MTDRPTVVRSGQLPESEARYPAPFDAEGYAFGRDLGTAAGGERIGAWRDRIEPGRRSGRLHAHLREEEAIYVLSGEPVLLWRAPGGPIERIALGLGDYVAFPAGTGLAHCLENPTDTDVEVLVVGERDPADRLAFPEQPDFEAWRADRAIERCWTEVDGPTGQGRGAPYRIETPHVILRPLETTDVWPLVREVRQNLPRLKPWFPWAQEVPSIDFQLAWIRGRQAAYAADDDYTLGAFDRSNALIGAGGLHLRQGPGAVELGYWITERAEGRGWVTEWVAGLTRLSLQALGYERVVIRCDIDNARSRAIPERLGFSRVATALDEGLGSVVDDFVLHAAALEGSPARRAAVRAWDAAGRRLI